MKEVIIIGGGPAGCTAAIFCARANLDTLLISPMFGGQLLTTNIVENYPCFKRISGPELTAKFEEHVKNYDVEIKIGTVIKIKKIKDGFEVFTENEGYKAKTLIIASGKKAKPLPIKNADKFEKKGISYCAYCDAPLFKGKNVAVIGGGNTGITHALCLSRVVAKVYLLEYSKQIHGEAILKERLKNTENVEIITNASVLELFGDNFLKGLIYEHTISKDKKRLEVDGIFVAIGEIPNSEFVDCEKNDIGEIIIDEYNMTSIKGIFACGDVTTVPIKQAIVAAAEGCKASLNLLNFLQKNQ